MISLKGIVNKATVQAGRALGGFGMGMFLAFRGDIDGPTYFGLVLLIAGFYFGKGQSQN